MPQPEVSGNFELNAASQQYASQAVSGKAANNLNIINELYSDTLEAYLSDVNKTSNKVNKKNLSIGIQKACEYWGINTSNLDDYLSGIPQEQLQRFTEVNKASQFYLIGYVLSEIVADSSQPKKTVTTIDNFAKWLNVYAMTEQFAPPQFFGTNRAGERIRSLNWQVKELLRDNKYTKAQQKEDLDRFQENFIYGIRSAVNILFQTYNPKLFEAFTFYDKSLMIEKNTAYSKESAERKILSLEKEIQYANVQLNDEAYIKEQAEKAYEDYEKRRGSLFESSIRKLPYEFEREIRDRIRDKIGKLKEELKGLEHICQILEATDKTKKQFHSQYSQEEILLINQLMPIIGRSTHAKNYEEFHKQIETSIKEVLPILLQMSRQGVGHNSTMTSMQDLENVILKLAYQIANDELRENEIGENNNSAPIFHQAAQASAPVLTLQEYEHMSEEISDYRTSELLSRATAPILTEEEYDEMVDQICKYRAEALLKESTAPKLTQEELNAINADASYAAKNAELTTNAANVTASMHTLNAPSSTQVTPTGPIYNEDYAPFIEANLQTSDKAISTQEPLNVLTGEYNEWVGFQNNDPLLNQEVSGEYDAFLTSPQDNTTQTQSQEIRHSGKQTINEEVHAQVSQANELTSNTKSKETVPESPVKKDKDKPVSINTTSPEANKTQGQLARSGAHTEKCRFFDATERQLSELKKINVPSDDPIQEQAANSRNVRKKNGPLPS